MSRIIALCCCFISALCFSCNQNAANADVKPQYFDLNGFLKNEAERLSAGNQPVKKRVFLNGKSEEKQMIITDWGKELSALLDADINKKSFFGKYAEETRNEGMRETTYSAKEDKLRIRKLDITYANDGTPVKVNAVLRAENILYASHQQLTYEKGAGYWISGKQTIRFLEPDTFSVSIIFQP